MFILLRDNHCYGLNVRSPIFSYAHIYMFLECKIRCIYAFFFIQQYYILIDM